MIDYIYDNFGPDSSDDIAWVAPAEEIYSYLLIRKKSSVYFSQHVDPTTTPTLDPNAPTPTATPTYTPQPTPEPSNPVPPEAGIWYGLYEEWLNDGDFTANFDWNTRTIIKSGALSTFDFNVNSADRDQHYQVRYLGCIGIPTNGTYTFYITLDDCTALSIDDQLVIDNTGKIGVATNYGPREASGMADLSAGYREFELKYNQFDGSRALTVEYEGPAITRQTIPNSALGCGTGPVANPPPVPTATGQSNSPLPTPTAQSNSPLPAPTPGPVNAEDRVNAPDQFGPILLPLVMHMQQFSWAEYFARSNIMTLDSDGDGLTDLDELFKTATSRDHYDTDVLLTSKFGDSDGNNVSDADEDPDGDGLSNKEEIDRGLDPLKYSSDDDALSDLEEIRAGTDPLSADTDRDGLTDDSELRLRTDPLNADSNGNGTPDGSEIYTSVATSSDGTIMVELTGVGDVAKNARVRTRDEDFRFQNISGQVGPAAEVVSKQPFQIDNVRINSGLVQESATSSGSIELMHYNLAKGFNRAAEMANLNAEETDSIATSTSSIFVQINYTVWQNSLDTLTDVAIQAVDDGTDTDGDGLTDAQEIAGFRLETSTVITTSHLEWDTDGDGLSDAEEVGEVAERESPEPPPFYTFPSNPNDPDSDDDGILEPDELNMGTDPYDDDSDGDNLPDAWELENDFDPTNENPDGDNLRDDQEVEEGTDPFYFDPTRLIAAKYAIQGALFGDFGETIVGWCETGSFLCNIADLKDENIVSLYYVSGWIASGFFGGGGIYVMLLGPPLGSTFSTRCLTLRP